MQFKLLIKETIYRYATITCQVIQSYKFPYKCYAKKAESVNVKKNDFGKEQRRNHQNARVSKDNDKYVFGYKNIGHIRYGPTVSSSKKVNYERHASSSIFVFMTT